MPIAVEAAVAAKLAFLDAFREAGIGKSEFGRRIGKDEKEVRRLLDPRHPTKLSTLTEALRAFLGSVSSSASKPRHSRAVAPLSNTCDCTRLPRLKHITRVTDERRRKRAALSKP